MSISVEKRWLIVAAKKRREREADIALWLDVSERSVATMWKLYRATGGVLPTKPGGRPSRLTPEDEEAIAREVSRTPDATLAELIERLSLPIQKSQLHRLLARLGYSLKKKRSSPRASSGRMSAKRGRTGSRPGRA